MSVKSTQETMATIAKRIEEKGKICPILSALSAQQRYCLKEDCAWWCDIAKQCSVQVSAWER